MLLVLSLSIAATACAPRASPNSAATNGSAFGTSPLGHLLIVGGGPANAQVVNRFVELAGGAGKARVVVFPMASAVASTGPDKVAELKALGVDAFFVDVKRADADADSVVHALDSVTGIWFSGGDQNRITTALNGTRTERAIRARYEAGAVVGGTSAGAAIMTEMMITGDERRRGGDRPPSDSAQAFITIDRENIVTADGLGLMKGAIVDQHFVRRRRHNRLISLVLEHPSLLGVGIDESTALDVGPGGQWEVIGANVVVIFDARAGVVTQRGTPLGGFNLRMHVLPSGSRFEPVSGRVTLLGRTR